MNAREVSEVKRDTTSVKSSVGSRNLAQIYSVKSIKKEQTYDWILNKHYAHRLPMIKYAFGLFSAELVGICTFGIPACNVYNDSRFIFGEKYKIDGLELNRLCINDNLEKNSGSYFVSQCLKLLPRPMCLISFADPNKNHHGYIYQATNWIYTGLSSVVNEWYDTKQQKSVHNRHIYEIYNIKNINEIPNYVIRVKHKPKFRYIYLLGDKKQKREMKKNFKLSILPYPKGDNKRYDASYQPQVQSELF